MRLPAFRPQVRFGDYVANYPGRTLEVELKNSQFQALKQNNQDLTQAVRDLTTELQNRRF